MSKIKNIDSLKIANTVPSKDEKINMIAKLVCETADLQRKNENLINILTELEDTLKRRINAYEERQNQGIDLTEVMTIRLASDKDTLDKIQELKEKYKC